MTVLEQKYIAKGEKHSFNSFPRTAIMLTTPGSHQSAREPVFMAD